MDPELEQTGDFMTQTGLRAMMRNKVLLNRFGKKSKKIVLDRHKKVKKSGIVLKARPSTAGLVKQKTSSEISRLY